MCCFLGAQGGKSSSLFPILFVLAVVFTLPGCGSTEVSEQATSGTQLPYQIDLAAAYDQREAIPLSRIAESISYIPLDTKDEALIGNYPNFYLVGDYIISMAFQQAFLFDKNTGAFIKTLKNYGPGPDEYKSTMPFVHADEGRQVVYVKDNRNLNLGLDVNGETRLRFKSPEGSGIYITSYAQLTDELFIGYQPNYDCKTEVVLVLFNTKGEVVKVFPNQLTCENPDPNIISIDTGEGAFYRWQDQVSFKEQYNDTLFTVTADSLIARAVFNSGEHSLRYEDKKKYEGIDEDFHYISHLDESDDYLFFELAFRGKRFSGYFDKGTGQTHLATSASGETHAYINDLDGFLPFQPKYATNDNLLVGYMEAPDVLSWIDENPEKAKQLPADLKQYLQLKADDNPVVMVVKLKD